MHRPPIGRSVQSRPLFLQTSRRRIPGIVRTNGRKEQMELLPPPDPSRPLTYTELRVMAMRYATHDPIKLLVEQAMQRRVTELHHTTKP